MLMSMTKSERLAAALALCGALSTVVPAVSWVPVSLLTLALVMMG